MNKKAIVPEALVRIVIAIIAVVVVFSILVQCYNNLAYSDAEKRFETLVETIRSLKDGEKKQQSLSLDNYGALIAFTKGSNAILFDPTAGLDVQLLRPQSCSKESACICICDKFELEAAQVSDRKFVCSGALQCKKISVDLPSTYTPDNFFPIPGPAIIYGYTFTNGFIIDRTLQGDQTIIPSPNTRVFTLSLIRKGNMLQICEPDTCKGTP